jgi:hypothetical protein
MGREKDDVARSPKRPSNRIDENLKKVYREMVEEEVPDRFQKLIEQLRKQDGQS